MTHVYPNFPLWREWALYNIDCSRQDVISQKRLPISCNAHTRLVPYDMRVQLQIHLWIFTHAFWRKPKEAFWCHHDKIWGTFQSKSSMMQAARSKKCSRNIFYDFVRFYRLINTATIGSWRCSCLNLHYFCGMILGDATIRQLFQVWFCNRYRLSAFLKEIKTYRITQEPYVLIIFFCVFLRFCLRFFCNPQILAIFFAVIFA